MERVGVYVGLANENKVQLIDDERNAFVLSGDQEVEFKLAVSMRDESEKLTDPSCSNSMQQYLHPDASFLQVPATSPEPRLFIVYNDGEAEEVLHSGVVDDFFQSNMHNET